MIWKQISDVVEFIRNGASIKQESGKGGYPITRIETIWNKTIDTDKFGYADIFDDTLESYAKYIMKDGDLLITHINSPKHLGKCAIYEGVPDKLIHGMNLLGLRAKENVSVPKYLKYFFNSDFFKLQLPKISNQSVNQASFSAGNLNKLKIPLPPLYQQKKIAAILDAADTYRQKTKALIEKYDELTQSLFLDMFGDPVKNPMGWEIKSLSEFIKSLNTGVSVNSLNKVLREGDFGILKTSCVYSGIFNPSQAKAVREDEYERMRLSPKADSIIISRMNTTELVGMSAYIEKDYNSLFLPDRLWQTEKTELLHNVKWLSNALSFQSFKNEIRKISSGTSGSMKNISKKNFLKLPMIYPSNKLQNQFAERVQAIEAQKSQAQSSLAQAEDLFNSLLQKAFKGELTS